MGFRDDRRLSAIRDRRPPGPDLPRSAGPLPGAPAAEPPGASAAGSLLLAVVLLGLATLPGPAAAQTVEVAVEQENFRQGPGGTRLATVNQGTRLQVLGTQDRWRRVVLEGWIWNPSVQPTDRAGMDLVVSAGEGENLRDEPSGSARIAARLLEGFLLEQVEERGNWTRVRRTAWIWGPSVREVAAADDAVGETSGDTGPDASDDAGDEDDDPGSGADLLSERLVVQGSSVRVRVSPEGDTVATLRPGADLRVLSREGDWSRVRFEGWVRTSEVATADSTGVRDELRPPDLRANPDQYRGERIRWQVQFISLERAEAVRTDFYEGEPFILARTRDGSESFVYLAVSPELLSEVEALEPLERIEVLGRVRTGRSALMGAPVLDLLALEPVSGEG